MAKRGLASRRIFCFHPGAMNQNTNRQLRTLLALGRVSNLPTVWSNCLAGWWLGGGGNFGKLPLLLFGVSALYTGGMFLNDAFDAEFDRQRRAERPIPSGAISLPAVWRWGFALARPRRDCALAVLGKTTGALTLALLPVHHHLRRDAQGRHRVAVADGHVPVLGLCHRRFSGRAGRQRRAGLVRRGAGFYVAGLGYLAQHESSRGRVSYWPLAMLAAPIFFAMLMNSAEFANSCHVVVARARACGLHFGCGQFFRRAKSMPATSCRACLRELFLWTGWRSRRYVLIG